MEASGKRRGKLFIRPGGLRKSFASSSINTIRASLPWPCDRYHPRRFPEHWQHRRQRTSHIYATTMSDAPIPSMSSGSVGSRFVSQAELDEAKAAREETWKAAYARYAFFPFIYENSRIYAFCSLPTTMKAWTGSSPTAAGRGPLRRSIPI